MFTKPFRVKSNTPIKGSERKNLKAGLLKRFPSLSETDLALAIPNKEEMSIMKIETHSGLIVTAHLLGKKPIAFHDRDQLYPTVYLLWLLPPEKLLIPFFTTWHEVLPKLVNGADLMLPGIIVKDELGMNAYGRVIKGQTVAVNSNRNRAAVAIGLAALSSQDMYMAGKRGKGIEILHCFGDFLWQAGTKESPPDLGPPGGPALPLTGDQLYQIELTETKADAEEEKSPESDSTLPASDQATAIPSEDSKEADVGPIKSPQEVMDELLDYCFLKALKTSAKKIELPVLTSNFYRLHIVPACPAGRGPLDVKKSSYKKLSKFLEAAQKDGDLVQVKELTKGVESITAIRYDHDRIRFFRIDAEDKAESSSAAGSALDSLPSDLGKYIPPIITRLYAVNAACSPLFAGTHPKGTNLTAQQVRQYLTDYVKRNELQKQNSVILDPILSDVLLKKGERADVFSWDELMSRCLERLSTVHQMMFSPTASQGDGQSVLIKGELECIDISTAKRSGNKKVTLISGLETYKIDLDEFAHRCQLGVAASTTITSSPAKKGQIVLVQGNQTGFVSQMLIDQYGIPKQFIKGFDPKKVKK